MSTLPITIIPGTQHPLHDEGGRKLVIENVAIIEQGTALHLPVLKLHLRDTDGAFYIATLTGRQACALAAVVRGINERNHGTPEP